MAPSSHARRAAQPTPEIKLAGCYPAFATWQKCSASCTF